MLLSLHSVHCQSQMPDVDLLVSLVTWEWTWSGGQLHFLKGCGPCSADDGCGKH